MTRTMLAAAALLLLPACSGARDDPAGTTSADEDRQLNDAAAMLDANSMDANALAPASAGPDPAATNESTP